MLRSLQTARILVRWSSSGKPAAAAAAAANAASSTSGTAEPAAPAAPTPKASTTPNVQAPATEKFLSPDEFVAKKKQQDKLDQEYKQELLQAEFEYKPQVVTKNLVDPVTKRPIPLNVELLKYRPIKLDQTHGHKVASITLQGFDVKTLDMASEFAARAAFYLGIPSSSPTNNRVKEQLYTVIRSPFAQAKSKENFKQFTYGRKIVAYDADEEVVDVWLTFLNKHKFDGVQYKANVFVREGLNFADELEKITGDDVALPEAYAQSDDPVTQKVQELLQSKEFKKYFDEK